MKLACRCLFAIGSFGVSILSSALINTPARAIPEAQVIAKLQNVPVYVITDDKGTLVETRLNTPGQNSTTQFSTGVFLSDRDAQTFIDKNLKAQQPDLVKLVKVTSVSLGEIYRRQQENKNKPEELKYVYVPTAQQSASALTILNRSGQKVTQIDSSPVFIATIKSKSGQDQYLTFRRDNREIVPIFFSETTLRSTVSKVYPNLVSKSNIRVMELNELLGYMTDKNDPIINNFEFNPSMNGR
ncbi:Tic22 family protein [Chamaesiphon sp. VAR_48_metabat_403]|uniref:Tic22 family protein n=1 Tax=Chamaesiphon sp. VAR_48_metabat_403 TaxID=2964700 RepID=UPI00286EA901|nr:Tic22 family protein [Chamaesiphon sp. VAR_48_metabat_403]